MIDTALIDQVFVACFPCDMRKSINGLSALVQLTFDMDPFANHLYVFFNRKGDKAKILEGVKKTGYPVIEMDVDGNIKQYL